MKCANVFARLPVGINSIIEPNRADRQFVTQAGADRVMHVINSGLFGCGQEIARVIKQRALEFAIDRKSVFEIEDGEKFAADRVALWIAWAEVALAITAHSGGAAIEETFVDRYGRCFIRARVIERVDKAGARTEGEQRLLKPLLQRRDRLIFHHSRCERFRTEWQEVSKTSGAAG